MYDKSRNASEGMVLMFVCPKCNNTFYDGGKIFDGVITYELMRDSPLRKCQGCIEREKHTITYPTGFSIRSFEV